MRYRYYICDVFTNTRFGGNQLAVLPEAHGLTTAQMQQITREFNFAESTFVLPPSAQTRRVRIFTPAREIPFAGHPNVGTAFVLATAGELGDIGDSTTVTFEEGAGNVPVRIERRGQSFVCELTAPEALSLGEPLPVEPVARAASLTSDDIVTHLHPPQTASVGLPFIMVEVTDRAALRGARIDMAGFEALGALLDVTPDIHLYVRATRKDGEDFDIHARMFAPLDGVPEDPATGSANCALAAMLAHYDDGRSGTRRYRISQGVELGRPSVLEARIEKRDGAIASAHIGGECVLVSEGWIEVG